MSSNLRKIYKHQKYYTNRFIKSIEQFLSENGKTYKNIYGALRVTNKYGEELRINLQNGKILVKNTFSNKWTIYKYGEFIELCKTLK